MMILFEIPPKSFIFKVKDTYAAPSRAFHCIGSLETGLSNENVQLVKDCLEDENKKEEEEEKKMTDAEKRADIVTCFSQLSTVAKNKNWSVVIFSKKCARNDLRDLKSFRC